MSQSTQPIARALRRRVARGALGLALVLALTACSGGEPKGPSPDPQPQASTGADAAAADAAAEAYVRALPAAAAKVRKSVSAKQFSKVKQAVADMPRLEEVEAGEKASDAYAAAQDAATRADAMASEVMALAEVQTIRHWMENTRYDLSFAGYALDNDLSPLRRRLGSVITADDASSPQGRERVAEEFLQVSRRSREAIATERTNLKKSGFDGTIAASMQAMALDRFDRLTDLCDEIENAYTDAAPDAVFADIYRDRFYYADFQVYAQVAEMMGREAPTLQRTMATQLVEVADAAASGSLTADAPQPGDAYRELALDLADKKPGSGVEAQVSRAQQLEWLLWRIREIEGTPSEAYDAAVTAARLAWPELQRPDRWHLTAYLPTTFTLVMDDPGLDKQWLSMVDQLHGLLDQPYGIEDLDAHRQVILDALEEREQVEAPFMDDLTADQAFVEALGSVEGDLAQLGHATSQIRQIIRAQVEATRPGIDAD